MFIFVFCHHGVIGITTFHFPQRTSLPSWSTSPCAANVSAAFCYWCHWSFGICSESYPSFRRIFDVFCFYLKDTWIIFFDHRIASCPQLLTLIHILQSKVVPEVSNGRSTAGLKYLARGAANTSEYNGVENSGVCGNHLVCLSNGWTFSTEDDVLLALLRRLQWWHEGIWSKTCFRMF